MAAQDWEREEEPCPSLHREGQDRQETVSEAFSKQRKTKPEPKTTYVHFSPCFTSSRHSTPHLQAWQGKAMKMSKAYSAQVHEISAWILMCLRCTKYSFSTGSLNTSTWTRNGMFSRFQTMLSHFGLPPLWLFPLEQLSSPKSIGPHCADWLIGADAVLCSQSKALPVANCA